MSETEEAALQEGRGGRKAAGAPPRKTMQPNDGRCSMTHEVLRAEMPSDHIDDLSVVAIQRSRAAAVRLWDEITQLLAGDPRTSGRVLPSGHRTPPR